MRTGDILHLKPTIDTAAGFSHPDVMPCTVVYIHPRRRFYVVEFRSRHGQTWRETFYFGTVSESDVIRDRHRPRGGKHYGGKRPVAAAIAAGAGERSLI